MLTRFVRFSAAVLSGVAASLLVAAATAAAAQNRPVVVLADPSVNVERVPYGDLNLAAAGGRHALYGRVGSAVRNVCEFDSLGSSSDYRACSAGAWKDARPQIARAIATADQLALSGQSPVAAGAISIVGRSR